MIRDGIVVPSESAVCSPVTLVPKKDDTFRFCVDYRAINAVTVRDEYPLPLMDDLIRRVAGYEWYCTLDLKSGYWQLEVDEDS